MMATDAIEDALRCLLRLDVLIAEGNGDTPEADEVRAQFERISGSLDQRGAIIVDLAAQLGRRRSEPADKSFVTSVEALVAAHEARKTGGEQS